MPSSDLDRERQPLESLPETLTKQGRKELLTAIESAARRGQGNDAALQQVVRALDAKDLEQARRHLEHLEATSPDLAVLDLLRQRCREMENQTRQAHNLRQAEEMLKRYIEQRKKKLAELAFETLRELMPEHPRLAEYRLWVDGIDHEVAQQAKVEEALAEGRAAIRAGDLEAAEGRLQRLEKLGVPEAATLQQALEESRQKRLVSADIERRKASFEEFLEAGDLEGAEAELRSLSSMRMPKITLDFLRQRLMDNRRRRREAAQKQGIELRFEQSLEARDWDAARGWATELGRRFPQDPRASRMFNEIHRREAEERRGQSIREGIATLDRLISGGERKQAELAIRVLERLEVDSEQLERYRRRIQEL